MKKILYIFVILFVFFLFTIASIGINKLAKGNTTTTVRPQTTKLTTSKPATTSKPVIYHTFKPKITSKIKIVQVTKYTNKTPSKSVNKKSVTDRQYILIGIFMIVAILILIAYIFYRELKKM